MRVSVAALFFTVLGLVAGSPAHAEDLQLPDFELADQFGNVHRRADVADTIVLLIGSDKGGSEFPEDPDQWVLMDWKGTIAKVYDFVLKSSNVLVFERDGALMHHASGREPDDETVGRVVTALRELLDDAH